MGDGFAKIYGDKLLRSTLFLEPPEARLVFLAMLAMANAEGVVDVPGLRALANVLNLEVSYVERALAILEAPDPDSRSKDHEGRRLLPLETGWQLVNYVKYREHRTDRQEQTRKRVAKHRKVTRNKVRTDADANANANAKEDPPKPPEGDNGDSLLSFARSWRHLTGRSEFLEFVEGCGQLTGTEQQWLTNVRKACGGSAGEFRARVTARMAEDTKGFLLKQTLLHWERGPLQAPAKAPPAPSGGTAAYHAALEPRDDDGPAVSYAEAQKAQETPS